MITLELLNKFSQESLRYKEDINVIYYTLNNFSGYIHLTFNNGGGELVSKERYENWLESKRDEQINQILS